MELTQDVDQLIERIYTATEQLRKAKSSEERRILGNYLYSLYNSLSYIIYMPIEVTQKNIFGSRKDYQKFVKKAHIDDDRVLKNFFENRVYHRRMFRYIINNMHDSLTDIEDAQFGYDEEVSKGEFFEIFSDFLKELHLGKEFDKYIKTVGIYDYDYELRPDCGGYMIHNPLTNESDVFVANFSYNVNTLARLSHEFGHVYDMSHYQGELHDYNRYRYQSFYLEVMSILFEKLLIQYLIDNNILIDDAKDYLIEDKFYCYKTFITSYMDSLLDYDVFKKQKEDIYSDEYISSLIGKHFTGDIMDFLSEVDTLDIRQNHIYAYGNIISMILKEEVDKYGFSNDMMRELFERRGEIFSHEFLDKYNVNAGSYVKGYQKELKLIKK